MGVILRLSLEQISNLRISIVSSITQGIRVAIANHPDLLLLDTDVIEVEQLPTIRALPDLQRVPIDQVITSLTFSSLPLLVGASNA